MDKGEEILTFPGMPPSKMKISGFFDLKSLLAYRSTLNDQRSYVDAETITN